MNELTTNMFENKPIRIVNLDGDTWFVGKDVCTILGFKDASNAMKRHCKGALKRHPLSTGGGKQTVRVIDLNDIVRLVCNSTLPAAQRFEKWAIEVVVTVMKTGSYTIPGQEKEGKLDKNIEDAIAARDKLIASKKESDEQYKQELERFNNLIDREEVKALLPKMPHTLVVEILNLARLKYGLYVKTQKNPELPGGEA